MFVKNEPVSETKEPFFFRANKLLIGTLISIGDLTRITPINEQARKIK